jgi:eukaryotic-like serine/threonine-protein kinase
VFQQEAQILARLQHPNVISVFDTGVDGGDRFIVMELVDGPTLRELLDTQGRLAPERAGEIASRLASALGFAHGKGPSSTGTSSRRTFCSRPMAG